MGGTIAVESEIGVGSVFTINLRAEVEQKRIDYLMVSLGLLKFLGLFIEITFEEPQKEN